MSWLEQVRNHFTENDPRTTPPRPAAPITPGSATGYAQAALRGEVDNVRLAPEGTRNHTLNVAAVKLGGLVAAGHLDRDETLDALYSAGHEAGLTHTEMVGNTGLGGTINSGLNHGALTPRAIPDRPAPDPAWPGVEHTQPAHHAATQTQPGPQIDVDQAAAVRAALPALDWHALFADTEDEEWIVEPILPARRLVALYSAPKVGKSLLMLEIAVAVARGLPVLGTKVDRPRRVLYVDFENDPKGDVRERLLDMGLGPGDLDNLAYLSFPSLAALDSPRGAAELLAAVEVYDCEVVVVDTVSRAVAGEENDNNTWLAFYRNTGVALKKAGVALVRLDHTGKDETKGQRGGSAKSGDVDMVWRLSRVTDEVYRLDCEAARMHVAERTVVMHREAGPLRHRVDSTGRAAAWDAKVRAVIEAMDTAELPTDAGAEKGRAAARAAGVRARNEVVAAAVKARKSRLG